MLAQVLLDRLAEAARLRHRELARLGAGAAGHVGDRIGVRQAEAGGLQRSKERGHVVAAHPPEHQVLNGGDAHGAVAVGARQIGEHAKLRAAEVAERHGDGRGDELLLLLRDGRSCAATSRMRRRHRSGSVRRAGTMPGPLSDAGVNPAGDLVNRRRGQRAPNRARLRFAGGSRSNFKRPPAFGANRRERVVECRAKRVPSHRLDQELHPVALLVLVVAARMEDANHRLGDVQHLRRRQEVEQHRCRRGHRRGAAADVDAETAHAVLRRARASRCR